MKRLCIYAVAIENELWLVACLKIKLVWCEVNRVGLGNSPQGRLMDFFTTSQPSSHCTALNLLLYLEKNTDTYTKNNNNQGAANIW